MFRPRSLVTLNVSPSDGKPVVPGYCPSPQAGTGQDDPYYNGAKHVSAYKVMKGRVLSLYHKLASISSARAGQTAVFLLLLLVTVGLWVLHAHMVQQATQPRNIVILDAGSTGTRIHVFQYSVDARSSYAMLKLPEPKFKVEPGLSSFADHAAGAGASLQPLLKFAEQQVPVMQQATTPVYLMATAGLRLVPPAAAEAVLDECRATLSASAFMFNPAWASVISGMNEGVYGWVAANYAAGSLQAAVRNMRSRKEPRQPPSTLFKALIEMGGASAQVTFVPEPSQQSKSSRSTGTDKHNIHLQLPGVIHPLWSHSYLGYGFDVVEKEVKQLILQQDSNHDSGSAAVESHQHGSQQQQQQSAQQFTASLRSPTIMDPCLPVGYISDDGRTGSGDWYQCQTLVAQAINPSRCRQAVQAVAAAVAVPAEAEAPCPELPSNMPKLAGELLAIENFAYTAHALDLPEHSSLGELGAAARAFCSRPFPQTLQQHSKHQQQQRFLWRYCFGSAFAWTLLHDVLRLGEGQVLQFTNTLHSSASGQEVGLDWALGAAVLLLSKSGGSEGAALKQQRQVVLLVLLAAVVATAAVLVAAGVAVRMWSAANLGKAATGKRFSGDGSSEKGIIKLGVIQSGAGKHMYRSVPVSIKVNS